MRPARGQADELEPAGLAPLELEADPVRRDERREVARRCHHRLPVASAGHRIRLEISNGDSPLTDAPFQHQYMINKVGRDTIHHSAKYPSQLILPIVSSEV